MAHISGRYGDLDYPKLAKYGFLTGAVLFLGGALGEATLASGLVGEAPGWLDTLLVDAEILGVLCGLLAPLIFGIVMPLTE
ncbi:hypothetical protein SAMN06269185_2269 [Natronoarchaeum philippinense]|uniref:Uncharacterized protein n=1 Tax=Natronoarchaeum philippinense TaxID=558529 RepID=A0A285P065_NATPI|nr:hypothetical protein [Natronoarchaeum philippinense]SNZ14828.1 hypothetical protein SAMN06269185_2269 [Natronoarchaeum philippinense]